MPAPGDKIDRFIVEELLGRGGMASVYRVRHATLGHISALKVLDLPQASIRGRMLLEGRIQSTLNHPNIVTVTDVIEVEGSPGLVMEYVNGSSLDSWLRSRRLDPATIDAIFSPVLDAVAFAHRSAFIHRDLKPGNILIAEIDGRIVPKVSDFGLAKALDEDESERGYRPTRSGFAMGSPGYMAPEQIRSAKHADQRADIFALGAILYELWCGLPPFRGDSIYDMLVAIEAREYADPRKIRPEMPQAVADAIAGCLEPDLDRRIATVDRLREMLYGSRPTSLPLTARSEGAPAADPRSTSLPSGEPSLHLPAPREGTRKPALQPRAPRPRSNAVGNVVGWVVLFFVFLVVSVAASGVLTIGLTGMVAALGAAGALLDTGI